MLEPEYIFIPKIAYKSYRAYYYTIFIHNYLDYIILYYIIWL